MVIMDKLTKSMHFIPVKSTYKMKDITKIFMKDVFKLHRLPKAIIWDHGAKLTSNISKVLF